MARELGSSQISALLESVPGIVNVLRSPVADAMVAMIRAGAGLEDFHMDSAKELVQYAVRRGLISSGEGDQLLEEVKASGAGKGRRRKAGSRKATARRPGRPAPSAARKTTRAKPARPAKKVGAAKAKPNKATPAKRKAKPAKPKKTSRGKSAKSNKKPVKRPKKR